MKRINQMEPWVGKEEQEAVSDYLSSGAWLTEYKKTQEFERAISSYTGATYTCVVSNGTVSLFIALMASGVGKGDEVIVPDFTMIATANAVLLAGAKPILVDIDPNTLCLDLAKAKNALTKNTKAIMYVSLNGRSADMEEVALFCKKYNLCLIEDAAQALGSRWNGKHLGTFGAIGSFSFSSPKVITTGQGGALITDDSNLMDKIRKIKDFGRESGGIDRYVTLGYNFKFTDLQAVIGIEQMKKLEARVKRKKDMYSFYRKKLFNVREVVFIKTNLINTSPWFIDILAKNRDGLIKYLDSQGIGSRAFYPPIHTQAPYKDIADYEKTKFPVSEDISRKGLWLPSSTFLTDFDIIHICQGIKKFYGGK